MKKFKFKPYPHSKNTDIVLNVIGVFIFRPIVRLSSDTDNNFIVLNVPSYHPVYNLTLKEINNTLQENNYEHFNIYKKEKKYLHVGFSAKGIKQEDFLFTEEAFNKGIVYINDIGKLLDKVYPYHTKEESSMKGLMNEAAIVEAYNNKEENSEQYLYLLFGLEFMQRIDNAYWQEDCIKVKNDLIKRVPESDLKEVLLKMINYKIKSKS